jgi:putative ABC transport system permease protein
MRAILRKAKADLLSRKLQSGLVLSTLVAATALLTLALTTLRSASDPFERTFAALNSPHLWLDLNLEKMDAEGDTELADLLASLADIPGVSGTTGFRRQTWDFRVVLGTEKEGVLFQAMPPEQPEVGRLLITAGRYLRAGDARGVVLDEGIARHFGVQVGDTIQAITQGGKVDLTVVGLAIGLTRGPYPNTRPGVVYALAETVEELQPESDQRGTVGLRLANPQDVPSARDHVQRLLPEGGLVYSRDWRFIQRGFEAFTQVISVFVLTFGAFALLAAGFIVSNVISNAVLTSLRDIGLVRAIGFTQGQVLALFVLENLLLGLVGAVLGLGLGLLLAPLPLRLVARALNASPVPHFDPLLLLSVVVGVELVIALFSLLPAWQGSRINTVQAIRYGARPPRPRPSRLAWAAARLRLSPLVTVGVKDLFARRLRTVLTVWGLALGVMTVVFALGLDATIADYSPDEGYDLHVSRHFISDAQARQIIEETDGVRSFAWGSYWVKVELDAERSFFVRTLGGDPADYGTRLQSGRWFQVTGEVVAGQGLLDWLDLQVGDELTALLDDQPLSLKIVGHYRDMTNMGRMLTMGVDTLRLVQPEAGVVSYYVHLQHGVERQAVRATLERASDDQLSVEISDDAMPFEVNQLRWTMLGLCVALSLMALVSVFNTTVLSVRERFHDFGTLKTLGMTPAQVVGAVLVSATLMALLATIIGIPLGLVLTKGLLEAVANSSGESGIYVSANWPALLLVFPGTVAVAALGVAIPARWAARVSVIETLRYE